VNVRAQDLVDRRTRNILQYPARFGPQAANVVLHAGFNGCCGHEERTACRVSNDPRSNSVEYRLAERAQSSPLRSRVLLAGMSSTARNNRDIDWLVAAHQPKRAQIAIRLFMGDVANAAPF